MGTKTDSLPPEYRTYSVSRRDKEPLLAFMLDALRGEGCRILYSSPPTEAPFRITFETPEGERLGVVAYAFFANSRLTKNRPADEHRFQLKYGSKDHQVHEIWRDPFGIYTTLFLGINPGLGIFVGADPTLHSPTRFFISIEFKQSHIDEIIHRGWFAWERESRRSSKEPVEVLVGGTSGNFLRFIRFERQALGEDQGHRQLLADRAFTSPTGIHSLAQEFELSEQEILNLIGDGRLKVAVRGSVAEEHLYRQIKRLPEVRSCNRLKGDGPDLQVDLKTGSVLRVECKNVLRTRSREGLVRLDFQRTRAAKSDPCSRYYSPKDFDVIAACLHSVTEKWEFRFALPRELDPHRKCDGKLSSNVYLDERWSEDPVSIFLGA
jgi:hypothetical protein